MEKKKTKKEKKNEKKKNNHCTFVFSPLVYNTYYLVIKYPIYIIFYRNH